MKSTYTILFLLVLFIFSCQSENNTDESEGPSPTESTLNGKALFQANCATCHHPLKDATGPALQGALSRSPGKEWIYQFVHNPAKLIADGDQYANAIYLKWNKTAMTAFPSLSEAEIDAIMQYCEEYK